MRKFKIIENDIKEISSWYAKVGESENRNVLEVMITQWHKDFEGDGYVQIFIIEMVLQIYTHGKLIKLYMLKYV